MEDPQNHGFRVLKSLQFWMIWGYPKIRKAAYIYIYTQILARAFIPIPSHLHKSGTFPEFVAETNRNIPFMHSIFHVKAV